MNVNKLMSKVLVVAAAMVCVSAHVSQATALSDDRLVQRKPAEYVPLNVASGTVIYAGALVAVDTRNYAVPASDTASLKVVGIAMSRCDQQAGVYEDGKQVLVRKGCFLMKNGGAFTAANIGDWAFVQDDQTVTTAAIAANDILAGVIVEVTSDGVWLDVGSIGRNAALSVTTLSASGAASLGSTLAVSGASVLSGTLAVTGATTARGLLTATNGVTLINLPTSTNGLTAGQLWVETNGVLNVKQ